MELFSGELRKVGTTHEAQRTIYTYDSRHTKLPKDDLEMVILAKMIHHHRVF